MESQTAHVHSATLVVSKVSVKEVSAPLNIVDQMKKTNVSVPMWDVVISM